MALSSSCQGLFLLEEETIYWFALGKKKKSIILINLFGLFWSFLVPSSNHGNFKYATKNIDNDKKKSTMK